MKRIVLRMVSLLILWGTVSACEDQIVTDVSKLYPIGKKLTVTASSGETPETKTAIQENGTSIYWTPGDAINLFYGSNSSGKFDATISEPKAVADFTGTLSTATGSSEIGHEAKSFWGIYPYNSSNSCDGTGVTLTIPFEQSAEEESFANKLNPSVATSTHLGLAFYNVGSWFIFSVTQEGVTSATFRGNNNEDIVGRVHVTMDANHHPVAEVVDGAKSITISAPNSGTFTPGSLYYIVLLPQTLEQGYTLTLHKGAELQAEYVHNDPAQFTRSSYRRKRNADAGLNYTTPPPPDPTQATNLSMTETANCYIVENEGLYCFKATQIGNGDKGIMQGHHFHVTDATIIPSDVILLWQDKTIIQNLMLQDGFVYFRASSLKGNAVIAVTDASSKILWSWHIWATDRPEEIRLTEATHAYLDRNLGATTTTLGLETSKGLFYQWGRKDPLHPNWIQTEEAPTPMLMTQWIENPTVFYSGTIQMENDEALWGNPDGRLSSSTFKTIYDPCPQGYTLPSDAAWYEYEYTNNLYENHRYYYCLDESITITTCPDGFVASHSGKEINYPVVRALGATDEYQDDSYYLRNNSYGTLHLCGYSSSNAWYTSQHTPPRNIAGSIRCVKEETYTAFPPTVETKDASSIRITDLVLNAAVSDNGNAPIKKVGFYWGLKPNEQDHRIEIPFNPVNPEGWGGFSYHLEDLPVHSAVYVRAFAENAAGCSYGESKLIRLKSATEYAQFVLDSLSLFMSRQYSDYGQGYNGEGTIRLLYGDFPGSSMSGNLSNWQSLILLTTLTNATSKYASFPLYYYYRIINKVNTTLDKYIMLADEGDSDIGYYIAALLGYRAYAYMMLAQLYCKSWDLSGNGTSSGLPLRIHADDDVTTISSLGDVYLQIYSDLDQAIDLMENSSIVRQYTHEIDIHTLYAIYAKAALNRRDYPNALSFATQARAGHSLMTNSDYNSGFNDEYGTNGVNPEWIWCAHRGNALEYENRLYYYSFYSYMGYNSNSSHIRNYSKCISKELFDKIPDTDIRKAFFLNPDGYSYNTSTGEALNDLKTYALYYAQSNGRRGLSSSISFKAYAYMQFKFAASFMPGGGQQNFIRAAEMVLIEAEANFFLGNEEETRNSLLYLNKLSGRDPQYECTTTGTELLEEVKFYRRLELWGEGFDWFDTKRWGDPISRKSFADGGNFIDALAGTWTASDKNDFVWVMPDNYEQYIRTGSED